MIKEATYIEGNFHDAVIKYLTTLNQAQIMELFHAINDRDLLQMFFDQAYKYLEEYIEPVHHDGLTDDEDALELDEMRRNREYKTDNIRPY